MKGKYNDMYSLFRHERGAEDFFNALPSYVQDRIGPRYQSIDSFERLEEYAVKCSRHF